MLGTTVGWIFCVGVIVVVCAVLCFRKGPIFALGICLALSFVVPVWLKIPVLGVPLSVQTTTAMISLLVFAVHSPWKIRSPLVLLDVLLACLVIVQALSDHYHGWSIPRAGLLAYGEWALPYVAGRYAMREIRSLETLAKCISGVVIILGAFGIIEMILGINGWELLFGQRPFNGTPLNLGRFGFKRAYGPTLHPIFFGLLILTLTPWPLALVRWAKEVPEKGLAIGALVASLGVISPVSRSPIVGMGLFLSMVGALWSKWARWILSVLAVLCAIWVVSDFNSVLTMFEKAGGEKRHVTKMRLDGKRVELSSAAQRVVLIQVFWPALREAGWLGYGSDALSVLPPRVPYLPADQATRDRLKYADNAFVMFGLRFGWLGVTLFGLFLLAGVWTGLSLAWDRSIGLIAGPLAAMITSMIFILTTAWFSYDMGFEVLWSIGILGGLASQQREFQH